ncbi:Long-chain-fatty-acid-CoA ligase FadD13 [Pseudomonas reidholzensis]|uniref:Long-chain-fatty-acid-CoA ligase FadD13 n=1 Tax=Pseudomonas reidholzensis TaxID=1785162 RepID=A0A383RUL5_9PSED|nr:acyl-CoA synthetase [Pseudomonas reidholzensis]SYX90196.1 Long-chain-fatty-acid-CoA ligase FadD13 [Pseudomonas reidholzensis]
MHPLIHASTCPDTPACILADSNAVMTYAELDARANQGAHLFRTLGLARGDTLAVVLGNDFDIFIVAWAAQRCGLYLTAVSTKTSAADLAYVLDNSGAKVLIAGAAYSEVAEQASAELGSTTLRVFSHAPGRTPFAEACSDLPTTLISDPSAGIDMLYSSGMTGRPKGVKPQLPTGPIEAMTPLMNMGQTLYGMGSDSQYLSTSPLYHAAPLRWAMVIQRFGGTVVIMNRFDAEQSLALIEQHRISHATFVPTHFVRMLKLADEVRSRYDFASLRAVVHAAAPCPIPVKQAMIAWWGPIVHEYYSGTETCGITALDANEWLRKPGSVGRAVLGKVKILGPDGEEVPSGTQGDVYFADGPKFEYHNDPEKTRSAHNDRGWATLNDIGWVDEEGYLYLTDRKSFMIISGGVNIYPQEIENLLITHPDIEDAAVIGAPDEEMGERVVAIVQPRRGVVGDTAFGERLRGFVRAQLGGVKCPQQFDFRAELPREPTGKLMKRLLKAEYEAACAGQP